MITILNYPNEYRETMTQKHTERENGNTKTIINKTQFNIVEVKQSWLTLSKYFGIISAMSFALAGDTSLGLMITQFPAAMAPATGNNVN